MDDITAQQNMERSHEAHCIHGVGKVVCDPGLIAVGS